MTDNLTWMPITRAARRFRTSTTKINELIDVQKVRSKVNPMNRHMKLVCVEDIRDVMVSVSENDA